MIVGPFFYDHQLFYAIRSSVSVILPPVIIIIVIAVIARVMAESIDPFLLPNFHMIRFTAFGQHPILKVAFRYEPNAASQACRTGIGESRN
jgi:p-aminobenzoyl-glutamate transporter AbgT